MNTDQINSVIRSLLKLAGAALVAHGLTNAAAIVNGEDLAGVIMAIIGMILSHWQHSDTNTTPPTTGTKVTLLALLFLPAVFLPGCAETPNQVAYQTAATAQVSVDTAMNLWGAYVAANHPGTNVELQVETAYAKYAAAASVVDDAGEAFAANGTNNVSLSVTLAQAQANEAQDLTDLETLLASLGVKL